MMKATFEVTPGGTGWTYLRDLYRKPLWVLMAMVALVLLICCANVASLLLARASAGQREIAVRYALGGARWRIVRQLLIESTALSVTGGAIGVGLGWLSGRFLIDIISTGPAVVILDLTPNWHVLAFTAAVAIATGILFGLAPALQMTAAGPSSILRDDDRIVGSRSRLLPVLVGVQVGLSVVLLIGAGLFVRTVKNLQDFDPGFKREGVLLVNFDGLRTALPAALIDDIRRVPGVKSASISTHTPLSNARWSEPAVPAGQAIPERDNATFVGASPSFFETMQTPLVAGREFADHDSVAGVGVAIVSEAYAQRFFPGQNPVGQHLSAMVRRQRRDLEIVGVARNVHSISVRRPPSATVYVSYAQLSGDFPTTLEIRASGSLVQVMSAAKSIFQQKLPAVAVDFRPLSAQVDATIVQERMMATLAEAFGILALVMSCVGIYGLLAYTVARRTKEIGIRMALGARHAHVMGIVVKRAVRPVLIGVALGLPAAWAASHWVESMLFGLKRNDPLAIVGAILLLAACAVLAAYLPAHRASRIDPLIALRHE